MKILDISVLNHVILMDSEILVLRMRGCWGESKYKNRHIFHQYSAKNLYIEIQRLYLLLVFLMLLDISLQKFLF